MTTIAPEATRKRRWPRIALPALALLLGAPPVYYFYATWSLQRATAAAVAETDRLDPRWRLEEIEADRKVYPDADNAAVHINAIVALLKTNGSPTQTPAHHDAFRDLLPQHQLTPRQTEVLSEAFEKIEGTLVAARKLKDMPGGRYAIAWAPGFLATLVEPQQQSRGVMDLLRFDVMLRAQQGDPDRALEACMALLNCGRALGDEPLWVALLIRLAGASMTATSIERVLAQGFPSEAPLAELQRRLPGERADVRTHLVAAMRGERAGHHQVFEALSAGKLNISLAAALRRGGPATMGDQLHDWFPTLVLKGYPAHLRFMNEVVAAARLPPHEQLDRLAELENTAKEMGEFTKLLAPGLQNFARTNLRIGAQLAAAEVAIACERFRIEHKRWPEALDDVVKSGKLAAIPDDPVDGRPLRYRRLPDGAVVYSIGIDKDDNQGALDVLQQSRPATDLGMRLWDPARRRQTPP